MQSVQIIVDILRRIVATATNRISAVTARHYARVVAAGGDVSDQVVDEFGVQAPPDLLGIHST